MSVTITPSDIEEIRDCLRARLEAGNNYADSRHIEHATGVERRRAGQALKRLDDRGEVELWSTSGSRNTYEILLDAGNSEGDHE